MPEHHPADATDTDAQLDDGAPCAVCGTAATNLHDGEPRCANHTPAFEDQSIDQLVDQLTDNGPEGAQVILPPAQAEALVHRVVRGHTRQQTADALGISKYTVDDRLKRAKDNIQVVTDAVRTLIALDLVDPAEDLGLDVGPAPDVAQDDEHDVQADASDETPQDTQPEETAPDDPWARSLADVSTVKNIHRREDRTAGTITLRNPDDHHVERVVEIFERAGYGLKASQPSRDTTKLHFDVDELDDVAEDSRTCHYCGEAFVLDDDSPDLLVSWNTDEDTDHPVCNACLADVAMGQGSIEVLPEYRDQPDDSEDELDDDRDEAEEADPAAPYADAVDETVELLDDEEDVETLTGIGPVKAQELRDAGYRTVEDVAEARVAALIDDGPLGPKLANEAHDEALDRLTAADETDDEAEDDGEDDTADEDADEEDVEPTDDVPEPFASLDPQYSGNEHEKRRAIYAAYQYLDDQGGAQTSEILDAVYSQHPAGYGGDQSWWRGVVRDGLKQVGAEYDSSARKWVVDDVEVETDE